MQIETESEVMSHPPTAAQQPHTDDERASASFRQPVATPPPVLASEALREDVAPLRPWQRGFRGWDIAIGIWFLVIGVLVQLGVWKCTGGGQWVAYGFGFVLLATALLPLSYVLRAIVSLVFGGAMMVLMLAQLGPMALVSLESQSGRAMALYAISFPVLAGALLFRSRYREFRPARLVVAVALVLALPAAIHAAMGVATKHGVEAAVAGALLVVIVLSAMGIFGEMASAISGAWAVVLVLILGVARVVPALVLRGGWNAYQWAFRDGAVITVACVLVAKGSAQLLAYGLAGKARRVDVMRTRSSSAVLDRSNSDGR